MVEDLSTRAKSLPIYLQIRQEIEQRIMRGAYAPGTMLPSENELAAEFGTTRLTVRNAVNDLVVQGVIRRLQGKGAFVAMLPDADDTPTSGSFRKMARERGMTAEVRVLARGRRLAGDYYAWVLGIEPDDVLYSLRRLNSLDGEPVSIENTVIPLKLFDGIEAVDIQAFSLYETYGLLGHEAVCAQEKLGVIELTARDAGLLHVEAGTPALVVECVSYDAQGQAIEYARSLSPARHAEYRYRY